MVLRPLGELHRRTRIGETAQHRGDVAERVVDVVPDVVDAPDGGWCHRCGDRRIHDVVHMQAIATLTSVAEHPDRAALQRNSDEHREEAELVAGEPLAWAVDVGEAEGGDRHVVRVGVHHVQLLAGELRDPVHVNGVRRMGLVDRRAEGSTVDLSCRGVDHPRVRGGPPEHLEEAAVVDGVQMQVALRVGHRRRVTDLTREVEDDIGTDEHVGDCWIADVDQFAGDSLATRQPVQVSRVAAVARNERVDDLNRRAVGDQTMCQVRADEAESARDDAVRPGKRGSTRVGRHGRTCYALDPGLPRRAGLMTDSRPMDADEYRRMAAAGDQHWWYRSTRALLRQLLEPHLHPTVATRYLDAGGGTGATGGWLSELAPTVLADYETIALDVATQDFPGYLPARADLNHLPFADASFDAVLCVTALCHRMNPDPGAIVGDFVRITRPGGIVCLMEPGGRRLWRGHDEITHTARRFNVSDVRELAEGAGLEILRATGAYTFLVPPAAILGVVERGADKSDVGRNESGLGGVMTVLAKLEQRWLRRWNLPTGLSAIVLARKPG